MKKLTILGLLAVSGLTAADVSVNLDGAAVIPVQTLARAKAIASSIFSNIGVRIQWTVIKTVDKGCPASQDATVHVLIADKSKEVTQRAVFGSAHPYASSGTRVIIFYDRPTFDASPALLAHVLVHEVGHVLQGVVRHSEKGVMKTSWTPEDHHNMKNSLLLFTSFDGDLIRTSIALRKAIDCAATRHPSQDATFRM